MNRVIVLCISLALTGCIIEDSDGPSDRDITCNHFADFINACTANCSVTWDCEANYDSLYLEDQYALDDCSDCLVANLSSGVCADCIDDYVGSCQVFMEDLLGVDCW